MVAIHEPQRSTVLSIRKDHETVVRTKNDIGVLFELSTLVADHGINILAVSGEVCQEDCVVRLLTDDPRRTRDVLTQNRFTAEDEDVLLVELSHRPGMLKEVTKVLAQAGIDIRHVHAAATKDQDRCLLVLHSARDEDALNRLEATDRP